MDVSKLQRGELLALLGGLILGLFVFVKCYEARPQNHNATLHRGKGGICGDHTCSFFQEHMLTRWLLLAAAAAPFILAYIIVRDHQLSWPRGQVTSLVAIAVLGLVFYHGIIERPGEPSGEIKLEIGWYGLMVGGILMLVGSVMRQSETAIKRKPPGTV